MLESDMQLMGDENTSILVDEAWKQLQEILAFLERLRDDSTTASTDCLFALALVTYMRGQQNEALDDLQRCYMLYQSKLGEYAEKTKTVEDAI